jgi:Yip1 domain
MNIIQRVQDILLRPKTTWPVIDQEPETPAGLYRHYLLILAAIPALASFIGLSLVGVGAFGVSVRVPLLSGLVQMVVGYVLSLVVVYLLALIVDALAPTFSGSKNRVQALKLVAYGSTAGFVGGIFSLLPSLSILGLLAAVYSVYLLYTGLPTLMKCPADKAAAYTAVVVVCGIVAMVVLGAVMALFTPRGHLGVAGLGTGAMGGGNVTIKTPGGEISIDSQRMEKAAKQMQEASQRTEAAQKSGDPAAAGKAMGEMVGAMAGAVAGGAGGATVAAIAAQDLKALLPEALGEFKRESFEATGGQAMGIAGSSAKASYRAGDKRVDLSITDLGAMAGVAALAGLAQMTMDKETSDGFEKVYKKDKTTVREKGRKDGSQNEYTVMLDNGVIVEARGEQVGMPTLKSLTGAVDLGKVEALKRNAKP